MGVGVGVGGGGGGGRYYVIFGDNDISGLIWGRVLLFASAIILLLIFAHNLCDDVCEARVWTL